MSGRRCDEWSAVDVDVIAPVIVAALVNGNDIVNVIDAVNAPGLANSGQP